MLEYDFSDVCYMLTSPIREIIIILFVAKLIKYSVVFFGIKIHNKIITLGDFKAENTSKRI